MKVRPKFSCLWYAPYHIGQPGNQELKSPSRLWFWPDEDIGSSTGFTHECSDSLTKYLDIHKNYFNICFNFVLQTWR